MRRMDRYQSSSDEERISRESQNKELYETIGTNKRYTDFSDVTNANAIDLSSTKNYQTREGYHQMKEYQDVVPTPRVKKELEEFKSLYQDRENRVYDINNVLEEARKNRIEKDELEEKRKLKNTSYNILASLNKEELEKYRQEKKDKVIHPDDEDLRELIDTITSKTLAGDIQAASELLSDLMATSIMDKVSKPDQYDEDKEENEESSPEEKEVKEEVENDTEDEEEDDDELSLSREILDLEELKKLSKESSEKEEISKEESSKTTISEQADEDFYTRSMDLSNEDFELDEEFKDKKMSIGMKILIILIVLIILAAVFYFIWKLI